MFWAKGDREYRNWMCVNSYVKNSSGYGLAKPRMHQKLARRDWYFVRNRIDGHFLVFDHRHNHNLSLQMAVQEKSHAVRSNGVLNCIRRYLTVVIKHRKYLWRFIFFSLHIFLTTQSFSVHNILMTRIVHVW